MADFLGKNITDIQRLLVFAQNGGVSFVTATDAVVLTLASPHLLFLDCGGSSRNLTYPDTKGRGCIWAVVNTSDAAEDITVKDPAGNTIITVSQNEMGIIGTDGTTWDGAIITIALT